MHFPDIRNAKRRLNEGSFEDARIVLQRILDEMPDHAAARVLMARSYESESRWASAALHWSVAARLCPGLGHVQSAAAEATLRAAMDVDSTRATATADFETDKAADRSEPRTAPDDRAEEAAPTEAQPASAAEYEDLDHLIEELEDARIVPDPDVDVLPDDELRDDIDDVVSETLARIYANQNYFAEAADVYEKLAVQKPDRRDEFLKRAEEMRGRAESS